MPGYYPPKVAKRPDRDSVPLIECERDWCGTLTRVASGPDAVFLTSRAHVEPRAFCSPGCASRWLIRFELNGNVPPPAYAPAPLAPIQGNGPTTAQIRSWARANGIPVADRARLSQAVVNAYAEAHR